MKTTKRFLSIMLIAIMTFCLSSFTVSADNNNSITITNTNQSVSIEGKTFYAYKLFNIENLNGAFNYTTGEGCVETGSANKYTINSKDWTPEEIQKGEKEFATALVGSGLLSGIATKSATAESATSVTISELPDGYYAVKADIDGNIPYLMLVNVFNGETKQIYLKLAVPSIEKYINHDDKSDAWEKGGDSEIGEEIKFKLEASLPNLNGYSSYKYVIEDTLSDGLDYVGIESIKCGGNDIQTQCAFTQNNRVLTFDFTSSIKSIAEAAYGTTGDPYDSSADKKIEIIYKAKLNQAAKVTTGDKTGEQQEYNENTAKLTYSSDPYSNATKEVMSAAYAHTFEVIIHKIENGDKAKLLANAEFQVKNSSGNTMKFTKNGSEETYIYDVNGTVQNIKTNDSGTFIIAGLDDEDVYTIEEIKAPDGYKKCEPIKFKITNDGYSIDSGGKWTTGMTLNSVLDNGASLPDDSEVARDGNIWISNKKGSTLVGTGGIGTTIFYIAGGVLMAGAVVLLVVKRRVNK